MIFMDVFFTGIQLSDLGLVDKPAPGLATALTRFRGAYLGIKLDGLIKEISVCHAIMDYIR